MKSWLRGSVGVGVSALVHVGLVLVLFFAPPPDPPKAKRRPPVRIKLASLPKPPPPKAVELPKPETPKEEELPPKKEEPKPEPKKPEVKPELPKPEPKPEPKKDPPKKKKKKRKKKKVDPPKKKPDAPKEQPKEVKNDPPPAEPKPKKVKFKADLGDGPGGSMAIPSGPGEGSRFGDVDGSEDGKLGGKWQPNDDERPAPRPPKKEEEEIVEVTEASTLPRLVKRPSAGALRAAYPAAARRDGVEADVRVKVLVNARGRVSKVRIVKSAGSAFDAAAKKLAFKLRFKPGTKNGEKVAMWVDFPIQFRLDD